MHGTSIVVMVHGFMMDKGLTIIGAPQWKVCKWFWNYFQGWSVIEIHLNFGLSIEVVIYLQL